MSSDLANRAELIASRLGEMAADIHVLLDHLPDHLPQRTRRKLQAAINSAGRAQFQMLDAAELLPGSDDCKRRLGQPLTATR
jgi:hypothetical protein